MPAYMGALSIIVGIGAGPQFPQSFESDPWQAPVIQQTQNVVSYVPPDQGDMGHAVGVFEDDGDIPFIVWPNENTIRILWDDGNQFPIAAAGVALDDGYAISTQLPWPDITTIIGPWAYASSEDIPAIVPDELHFIPRIVWPSWTPTPVVYDDAEIAVPPPPIIDELYFIPRIVWPSWSPTGVVYDDADIAVAPPPILDELYFIPRILWPSWTPTSVVYDDAHIGQAAVPLLVEWQEWQRPIIWPSGPPFRALQPYLSDPSNWFSVSAFQNILRVADLGDCRYHVTDDGAVVAVVWDADTERYIAFDASGHRYLVRDWGLPRYGVSDV